MAGEDTFLANLPLIERIIRFVCHRHGLRDDRAEDFAASVRLRLIENDYGILRAFEGRSSLATYLSVVIQRMYMDDRNAAWGKWRPSVEARRAGPAGIALDEKIHRDHKPLDVAVAEVLERHPDLDAQTVRALAGRLPVREVRARQADTPVEDTAGSTDVDETASRVVERERNDSAAVASAILTDSLASLPPDDRLLVRMRFFDALRVSDIARILGVDQKPLYRRLDRLLGELRGNLETKGVHRALANEIIGSERLAITGMSSLTEITMSGPSEGPKGIPVARREARRPDR